SEHQRDLTNSASSRFIPEILAAFYISIRRLNRTMLSLKVDKENLKKNLEMNKGLIVAEPLYILLAAYNHPDAHETVKQLTLKAQLTKKPLQDLIRKENSLQPYLKKFTKEQLAVISNPENYVGIASKKTESVCQYWKKEFRL
ncbi:MAG: adenylosuccinate lyase, partial [Bacteroidetes bacterium]|nr:adenylosuccinate lyase [Bacteroidota bacterium]